MWITGRVSDKATGEPVPASLIYAPFRSNRFAANLPEFKSDHFSIWDMMRNVARPDGTYRLVGLPGRGVVAARAFDDAYRVGGGVSKTAGMTRAERSPTYFAFEIDGADLVQEINPTPGTESATCDLAFDPAGTLRIALVDSAGKPAGPCQYWFSPMPGRTRESRTADSTLKLNGLAPDEWRPIWIEQPQRRIGMVLLVHYDEQGPRSLSVTLKPCATVKGRLVDEEGIPFKHARLVIRAHVSEDHSLTASQGECDSDGRFVLETLAPGAQYYTIHTGTIHTGASGKELGFETVAERVVFVPGQTIDLGDVTLKRQK